ncbi:MAG TPA: anhydro-N-acetylmuramic acid kinase [Flavisolibacter sp.]|nr:anhydro-N-acetylmuramic acid kinase [Flavisolibacter sp.]
MVYRAIGLMSGSSLDGLDIAFAEIHENSGSWSFDILAADCYAYPPEWKEKLEKATTLNALDYQLLHTSYGHYLGREVNRFIDQYGLHFKVGLVSSHGHTTFHVPSRAMTAQLGDGAAIAAETGLPVISDLRAMDIALGGQGAPIVPIGEKLLFSQYPLFLNLGGIANISFNLQGRYIAFDICPANRVLNMLAAWDNKSFDAGGEMASMGKVNDDLLRLLNALDYYRQPHPKSLANNFGTDEVYPLIKSFGLTHNDALRTYVEHVALQVASAVEQGAGNAVYPPGSAMLVTGGGAFNTFLVERLRQVLEPRGISVTVPDEHTVNYKEALVMALAGVLRWRQENTVLSSVTGAARDSIGGAIWMGQEA